MKTKTKQFIIGIIIIAVSVVVIFFNLKSFEGSFKNLWPVIVLLLALVLYIYYFSTKKKKNRTSILFLATFLAIASVPLFVLTFTSFSNINIVWPGFLFALGVGMLSAYFYGKQRGIILFSSSLLISISLLIWVFYSIKSRFGLVIGVSLLLIGAAFLTRGIIKEPQIPSGESEEGESEKVISDIE